VLLNTSDTQYQNPFFSIDCEGSIFSYALRPSPRFNPGAISRRDADGSGISPAPPPALGSNEVVKKILSPSFDSAGSSAPDADLWAGRDARALSYSW